MRLIAVPTDFSECSDRALDFATGWARSLGARVELINLLNPWQASQPDAAKLLDERTDRVLDAGVSATGRLVYPDSDRTKLEKLDFSAADWIIMGTHGRSALKRAMLGSWAEDAVTVAPCPVITVGLEGPEVPMTGLRLKTVVVGMDFSELARAALRDMCSWLPQLGNPKVILVCARAAPPDIVALYRDQGTPLPEPDLSKIQGQLDALLIELGAAGLSSEIVVSHSGASSLILETARQHDAGLIALGTHGRGVLGRAFLGSTALEVLREAPCPVYTTRLVDRDGR